MVAAVRVVCPQCDAEGMSPGAACTKCGARLVQVADTAAAIGSVIDGRFEIVAQLGQGGMGTVYRAKQLSIGREVALKVLDRRFDRDLAAVKRFLREAQLASKLAHPNVVGVIDFGQAADGALYIAMELVRGRTLREVIDREGALPLERVRHIGIQLCDALEAAHALSIVHRDLKLDNIMMFDRDLVKVLDFGLARSLADPDSKATKTGTIAGTPLYMPPEVAFDAAEPTPAQDCYALGVILGELSLGRALWDATTMEALFVQKAQRPPRLDAVDPALRGLVERLLATAPAERPGVAAVRAALASAAPPSASFKPPASPSPALELEPEWQRVKAARQQVQQDDWEAADKAERRRRFPLVAILGVLAIVGVVVAVLVVMSGQSAAPGFTPGADTPGVAIEVAARPNAKILIDGHSAGTTPLTLHVPRSTQPVTIEAVFRRGKVAKQVVPDHDQLVDFHP